MSQEAAVLAVVWLQKRVREALTDILLPAVVFAYLHLYWDCTMLLVSSLVVTVQRVVENK